MKSRFTHGRDHNRVLTQHVSSDYVRSGRAKPLTTFNKHDALSSSIKNFNFETKYVNLFLE